MAVSNNEGCSKTFKYFPKLSIDDENKKEEIKKKKTNSITKETISFTSNVTQSFSLRSEQPPNFCRHHFKFIMHQNGCFPSIRIHKQFSSASVVCN